MCVKGHGEGVVADADELAGRGLAMVVLGDDDDGASARRRGRRHDVGVGVLPRGGDAALLVAPDIPLQTEVDVVGGDVLLAVGALEGDHARDLLHLGIQVDELDASGLEERDLSTVIIVIRIIISLLF